MTSKAIYYCVYRITNLVEKKHYYGYKSSKIHPSKVVGVTYFSSSTDKEFKKDQKLNPQNYRYKIVAEFDSKITASLREVKLHQKFNVRVNPNFYNRANASSNGHNWYGVRREVSEETRMKLSNAFKGKPRSEEIKAKIAKANTGKIRSTESKYKQSERQKGKPGHILTKETKLKIAETLQGHHHSDETKLKMSIAKKGKPFHYTEQHKLNQSKAQRKFYYITPIGTIDRPDLLDPIITDAQLIRWCSNLDKNITKSAFSKSKYFRSNFTWEQISGKTYRELGFDKIRKS